ncbi:MAG: diguanylate cyclase, partial [Candidatus Thiodiazotropha sp. (ex Notomyrtea botanica)]|nr:diguanylate cyclase [Candidatus Thiodiazotropha sp. (ex Notomyrtea botanica)]
MDDAILVTDMALKIVEINPAFTRVTGYSRKEALGQAPGMLSSGRHDKKFYEGLWHALISNGYWKGTIWNRRKNGEVYPEWLSINTIKDPSGEATHYLATFSDLSHQNSFQNQIHLLAYYDSLTGLPNRELFSDRLNLSISQAHRDLEMLALFFLDLDHFKAINDSLGHSTGDQLLRSIATRLSSSLRESDTVA